MKRYEVRWTKNYGDYCYYVHYSTNSEMGAKFVRDLFARDSKKAKQVWVWDNTERRGLD